MIPTRVAILGAGFIVDIHLEMLYAAYESARTGCKVALPFRPKVSEPVDLWRR